MSLTNYIPDEEFTIPTRKVLIEEVKQGYDLSNTVRIYNTELDFAIVLNYLSKRFLGIGRVSHFNPQNEFVFRLPGIREIFVVTLDKECDYRPCSIDGFLIFYHDKDTERKHQKELIRTQEYLSEQSKLFNKPIVHYDREPLKHKILREFSEMRFSINNVNREAVKTLLGK